jgi:hypothetical protein
MGSMKRESKLLVMEYSIRSLARYVRCATCSFVITFFGGGIVLVLCVNEAGGYTRNIPFLALSATTSAIVYYLGDRLGWALDCIAEHIERNWRLPICEMSSQGYGGDTPAAKR